MRRAAPPAAQDGHPTRPNSGRPRRRLKKSGIQWWLVATICAALNGIAEGENPARPSIIMISIDTLRADHLGVYGYAKIHTPHVDSFALGGSVFIRAEAQLPLTLPSHTSLFTSTYPFQNRVEENGERVPAGVVTLASALRSHGYETAAFIGSEFLDRRYGLDQGFDVYDSPFGAESRRVEYPLTLSLRRDGALVVRAARQWLEEYRGSGSPNSSPRATNKPGARPVFVFVHLFDLHTPYTLPPEVARKKGLSRYDSQLEYVDELIGRFQQELKQGGWWDASLVVLLGDHGEGLGDHQESDHGYYIYESTLHVPVIIHWPSTHTTPSTRPGIAISTGSSEFRASFSSPVGLIDVAPTILDFLRIPAPASFEGRSQLTGLKAGNASTAAPIFSESLYAHDAFGWAPLRGLRVGRFKYIQASKAELYDLQTDPHERLNLLARNAAMAAELENELANLLTRYAPAQRSSPAALPPETLAQLESLGYLAAEPRGDAAGTHVATALPDPKDRFAEFELYQAAFVAFTAGHTAEALSKFQSVLQSDPRNTLARFHLGECYLRTKHPQDALHEWNLALKFDPHYAPSAEAIGQYWLQKGDYSKARLRFQQVLALTPDSYSGHFQLALADEHLGLVAEARQHLETACQIAPHDESCKRELKSLSPIH
jgi:choline-sulfatase